MSKLSVISKISGSYREFNPFIEKLAKGLDFNTCEVILIIDEKNNEAINFVKNNYKQIQIQEFSYDENIIKAYNISAKKAKNEILVFLDSNTFIPKIFTEKILSAFNTNNNIGVASSIAGFGEEFFIPKAIGFSVDDMNKRLNGCHKAKYPTIPTYDGNSYCIHKKTFEEFGAFDENLADEDFAKKDLALKLNKAGYKNILIDDLYVYKKHKLEYCDIQQRRIKEGDLLTYREKWENFLINWYKNYSQKNPVLKIEKKMFPIRRLFFGTRKYPDKTQIKILFFKKAFSIKTPTNLKQKYKKDAKIFNRKKPTIVVMEAKIPEFDKNAGDKSIWHIINSYLKLNFNVIFASDDYLQFEPYSSIMREKGIKLINDFGVFNKEMFFDWLKYNSKNIDYFLLVRPTISIKYLDKIKKYKNIKILYYGQDLHFLREQRDYELTKNIESLKESKKFKKIETKLIKNAKMSYYPSVIEKEIAKSLLPKSNVEVVPVYMYDINKQTDILPFSQRKNLLFVGGFKHKPNKDGVLWFINEVFDDIKKEIPDIVFNIVGSNPTNEIIQLQSNNINVLGFVSDEELSNLYKSTRVVVAPLRFGAGMKGKIVEALYNKCPIVTTLIGAEGINNLDNAITIADDAKTFAKKVVELYLNKELNEKNSNNSFKIIENQFSDKIMQEVLQKGVL